MIRQNRLENSTNSSQYKEVHGFDLVFGLTPFQLLLWANFECSLGSLNAAWAAFHVCECIEYLSLSYFYASTNKHQIFAFTFEYSEWVRVRERERAQPFNLYQLRVFLEYIQHTYTYSLNGKSTWGRLLPRADMIIRIITAAGNSRICK